MVEKLQHFLVLSFKKNIFMLFLTNKLDYITQVNNVIIKSFLRLGSFIAAAR